LYPLIKVNGENAGTIRENRIIFCAAGYMMDFGVSIKNESRIILHNISVYLEILIS
jgi:hypothetical protein